MNEHEAAETANGILSLIAVAILWGLWSLFTTPKGWIGWHWDAVTEGKPVVAYECLDRWRPVFNDPEAVHVFDAAILPTFHEVDVEVRGKNKMGAWVKGSVTCALKPNGDLDADATIALKFSKMSRPEDGEVPP